MAEDTTTLVFKITMSNGDIRRHAYSDCPITKDAFHKWWGKQMENIFSSSHLRKWVKLENPYTLYNTAHIAIWEFECADKEVLTVLLSEEADFMLRIV